MIFPAINVVVVGGDGGDGGGGDGGDGGGGGGGFGFVCLLLLLLFVFVDGKVVKKKTKHNYKKMKNV